jgi:hypothetical protein
VHRQEFVAEPNRVAIVLVTRNRAFSTKDRRLAEMIFGW